VFLRQLVAAAPDVPVQIAHLWGGESYSADALEVFAEAFSRRDPVTRDLFFDVSGVAAYGKPADMPEIVKRIRQIGMDRIVYGSDAPPSEGWNLFRKKVPLTEAEFRAIASNVAPYLRSRRGR
jgi:predicted TIM-barrel fold metal-dependent hydrolase